MRAAEAAELPWGLAAASGVGSMPGEDPAAAIRMVLDEVPDLPFLPELPARGPGAGMTGRGVVVLADVHADVQPSGWRLVPREGLDERRARSLLARDLDTLEEQAAGYAGPLKVQLAGPWTLAATIELARGGPALADPGAARDIAAALAEGVTGHLEDLRRRVPGAQLLLQLDEPALPAVLAARVPTASGLRTVRGVEPAVVRDGLRRVLAAVAGAGAVPVVHCCAADVPVGLFLEAGARAVSLDATLLTEADDEVLGTALEAGAGLLLGVVPAAGSGGRPAGGPELSQPRRTVSPVREMWRRLGLSAQELRAVVLTPTCGLAGASVEAARAALRRCRESAAELVESGA